MVEDTFRWTDLFFCVQSLVSTNEQCIMLWKRIPLKTKFRIRRSGDQLDARWFLTFYYRPNER